MPEWRRELTHRVGVYRARRQQNAQPLALAPARAAAKGLIEFPTAASARPTAPEFAPAPQLRAVAAAAREVVAEAVAAPARWSEDAGAMRMEVAPAALRGQDRRADGAARYLQLPLPMAAAARPADSSIASAVAVREDRVLAAALDAALVMGASGLFALVTWTVLGQPGLTLRAQDLRHWLPACAGVPALLAAVYLLLCAHWGGSTLGLRWRGLHVAGADGPADAAACRRRGWASLISLGSLGLGFAWIFCDLQGLSWHDVISRTWIARDFPEEG